MTRLPLACFLLALPLGACRSLPANGSADLPADGPAPAALSAAVDELYAAFDFGPGGEADWDAMRALFLPGATFVAPVSPARPPAGEDAEAFLTGFQTWSRTGEYSATGLHERILSRTFRHAGHIAHAWVRFEGYLPRTGEIRTRGIDSIAFVRDGERWKVASFSTQYDAQL